MTWEEACRILGVAPDATEQQIKDAYHALAQLLHPDVHQQKSEKVRKKAEDEFKKVNQAYDILKDLQNRPSPKPKLEVQPDHIIFNDVAARQIQTAFFDVRYQGDASGKNFGYDEPTWVTIVDYFRISPSTLLPIRVEIEVTGQDWDKSYEEYITVRLNGEEAKVKVELQTSSAPVGETDKATPVSIWRPRLKRFLAQHKKKVAWAITIPLTLLIVWIAGGSIICQSSIQSAILGKWQHGLSQRPPNMGSSTYELIKSLPESKPYSLEFSKNGQLLYISEGGTHSGKYSFVGQNSVQITWSSSSSPPDLGLQGGIYEVRFSGNKMGLIQQGKKEVTFTRIE